MDIKIKGSSEIECVVVATGVFLIKSGDLAIRLTPMQAKHLEKFISEGLEYANAKYHEFERGK